MKITRRMLNAGLIAMSGLAFIFTLGLLGYLIFGDLEAERPTRPNPLLPVLFVVSIFSLGGLSAFSAFFYYFPEVRPRNRKLKSPKPDSKPLDIVMYVMSDDEAEVLKAVKQLGERTYQFEIAKVTGMSRMKVHRVLKKLEDRQILERDKDGRGSRVFLAEWLN